MTKRRHYEFSDNLAAAKHLDSSATAKNAVSFCSAAHPTPFKKDFSHCVETTLGKLFLDSPRNLTANRSTLSFYLLKSAGHRSEHRREKGGKLIKELQ
jgi:hypothetical protein